MSAPQRLFLAVWPDPATRQALLAHADRWQLLGEARRVPPEMLHMTLHFLGNVESSLIPDLASQLSVPFRPFELVFDRAQIWPGGIAVLEASLVPPALAELHRALREALAMQGLQVETRRYRPHVTFARRAAGAVAPAADTVDWRAEGGYELVRSLPGAAGYPVLRHYG